MKNAKNLAFLAAVAILAASCSDRGPDKASPTGPTSTQFTGSTARALGGCTTIGDLNALAALVFGDGSPNVNSVLGKLDNLRKKVEDGDETGAIAQANNIVAFVREKAGDGRLAGTSAQIDQFIAGVLCYSGQDPNTFLIQPTDLPQIKVSSDGTAGVSLDGNTVNVPTLLTLATLPPTGPSPLVTLLDQYPSFVSITVSSAITKPADVRVCPTGTPNAEVRARLRLGHQAAAGFEIAPPPAKASFDVCPPPASLFASNPFAASIGEEFDRGGVGGSVTEFSPFGAVDPELELRGGVGGSVTEFIRSDDPVPAGSGRRRNASISFDSTLRSLANTVVGGVCTDNSATVGTGVEPECRPTITLTTHNGTILTGVPVNWSVTNGGGTVAADNLSNNSCGAFGATAATSTDSAGKAAACWILGPNGGTNTALAAPAAGGDAPAGVTFSPAQISFTAEGLKITPTASATGGSFVFDALSHAGAGTCSHGLVPALSYSGGSAPVNVGDFTLTVTCGEGSTVYNTATATAIIGITPATPVIAVSCPDSVIYNGSTQAPCSATATGPGLSAPASSVSYANNMDVGTATANGSYTATGNYAAASGSATFRITKAASATAVSCPASATFTGGALTPCSATATGVGGLGAAVAVSYSNNVNVGTANASASYAGDANHLGSNGAATFAIAPAATVVAVSCPGSVTYNAGVQAPCSASVTGPGLSGPAVVSYAPASPKNVGSYSAIGTFGGGGNYLGSTASTAFAIIKAAATATAGNATMNFGASVPTIPCSVTGLLAGDAGSVTCTSSVPPITIAGSYPTSPVISPASPTNYAVTSVNGTLTVAAYVQVGCFSSPVYSVMPESKSAQRKGSNLPIKCTLRTPEGATVTTATGSIAVMDVGPSATVPPAKSGTVVFSGSNVFRYSNSGNYAYGLDTSPAGFVIGHYYYVIATWNDGSKTEGWFLLK